MGCNPESENYLITGHKKRDYNKKSRNPLIFSVTTDGRNIIDYKLHALFSRFFRADFMTLFPTSSHRVSFLRQRKSVFTITYLDLSWPTCYNPHASGVVRATENPPVSGQLPGSSLTPCSLINPHYTQTHGYVHLYNESDLLSPR